MSVTAYCTRLRISQYFAMSMSPTFKLFCRGIEPSLATKSSRGDCACVMGCSHDPADARQTSSKCIHNTHANAGRLLDRVNTLLKV